MTPPPLPEMISKDFLSVIWLFPVDRVKWRCKSERKRRCKEETEAIDYNNYEVNFEKKLGTIYRERLLE